ncbi:hypothetical protein [Devosia sp. DBB001]|nr:hypothetical protein [Devosia sp. DBB001]
MTAHVAIDVAAVAARIHRDGRRARVSHFDLLALADFVVATLAEEAPVRASLAASVAVVLRGMDEWQAAETEADRVHEQHSGQDDDDAFRACILAGGRAGDALRELANSLSTLKTVFEQEFPNG